MDSEVMTRSMWRAMARRKEWTWHLLPEDLYVKIFCLLPAREIATSCALVCRSWRYFSSSESLWKELSESAGIRDLLYTSGFTTWRALFGVVFGTNLIASPHFERVDRIDAKLLKCRELRIWEPKYSLHPDRLYSEDERHEEPHSFCHWVLSVGGSRFQRGGGDGIIRECPPVDCRPFPGAPGKPVLATSHDWGTVYQSVDLSLFPRRLLDLSRPLLISVWYAGRRGTIGLFKIRVGLRDKKDDLIFSKVSEDFRAQPNIWREAKAVIHGYPKGMRSIVVLFSGMSTGKKKTGFHGAKYTAVRMKFMTATETVEHIIEGSSAPAICPSFTEETERIIIPKRA